MNQTIRSYTAGVLAMMIWASVPNLLKVSLLSMPISNYLLLRFLISTVVVFLFARRTLRSIFEFPLHKILMFSAVLGSNYWLQSMAIVKWPTHWYIAVFALNPIFSLIWMQLKFNSTMVLGLGLGLCGVLAFTISDLGPSSTSTVTLEGLGFMFGGMLSWVAYTLMAKHEQHRWSDMELTLLTQLSSLIASISIWLLDGGPHLEIAFTTLGPWLALGVTGLGLPVAYFFYLYSLRNTPIFSQLSQYLELFFGLFFSWIILGTQITPVHLIGLTLIVVSLYVATKAEELQSEVANSEDPIGNEA